MSSFIRRALVARILFVYSFSSEGVPRASLAGTPRFLFAVLNDPFCLCSVADVNRCREALARPSKRAAACFRLAIQIASIEASAEGRASLTVGILLTAAPVAQLDRASGYEPEGQQFESVRAHHFSPIYNSSKAPQPYLVFN